MHLIALVATRPSDITECLVESSDKCWCVLAVKLIA